MPPCLKMSFATVHADGSRFVGIDCCRICASGTVQREKHTLTNSIGHVSSLCVSELASKEPLIALKGRASRD